MSIFQFIAGPFTQVAVGQWNISTPMTQVDKIGTGEYKIGYTLPKSKWLACINGTAQNGLAAMRASFTFISDDPQAITLAMSNWLTAAQDAVPSGQQFTLLFVDSANPNSQSSLWIPRCEVEVNWDLVRSKKAQTDESVKFFWNQRDSSINLFYKRTPAQLKSLMGVLYPF